ncbi:glycosyltransferase family 2 protein [Candidatus Woesearchaeota archaeon]|nr:glycosyltransferase family 2 protein [Candidatus Woesearchaeota archaeon]
MDYIVIPAYNEGKKLGEVIRKAQECGENIVVVDDGSSDDTFQQAKQCGVTVLKHLVNMGKGAALKTGCDFAYKQGAERYVVLDSDGQHDPKEIPRFFKELEKQDIVFGYRQLSPTMPLVLKFGNWFINRTLATLFHIDLQDSQSGYRAFTRKAYEQIRWEATDYYMETEMIIKAGRKKLLYTQIPIETIYGDKYKGTTVLDGVKIVVKMLGSKVLK